MFVKVLLNKDNSYFVEDEIGRFIGFVRVYDFYDCIILDDMVQLEDEDYYWKVDKDKLYGLLRDNRR